MSGKLTPLQQNVGEKPCLGKLFIANFAFGSMTELSGIIHASSLYC